MDKLIIQDYFAQDYLPFYKAYLKDIKVSEGKGQAICPFHKDTNPSLSLDLRGGFFNCFGCHASGDCIEFFKKHFRVGFKDALQGIAQQFGISNRGSKQKPFVHPRYGKLVKTYDYVDSKGMLLYQVCRMLPKDFRQRRPGNNGNWIWNMKNVETVLYHLQEVVKSPQIIIVEGEKDVDNLRALGYVATCNPGGALKWKDRFSDYLKGKDIILIPDNDESGRDHMIQVAQSLKKKARFIKWLNLPGLPEKGDVSDFIKTFENDKDGAVERLAIMIDGAPEYLESNESQLEFAEKGESTIRLVNVDDWLKQDPSESDQIIEGTFESGDKIAIISSSKSRKSFFLLQMLLSITTGRGFLTWEIPQRRRVLYVQFEIKESHLHKRIKRMCRTLNINDLNNNFKIINARGLGLSGGKGIDNIWHVAKDFKPEVIAFDPLYKLMEGIENAAEDGKKILNEFDRLVEESGAAVIYVHHDAKGSPGDRDIRDRGAGSNVIARDYDACLTLTAHATDSECYVIDALLRNYKPQAPFTIQWAGDESSSGYKFEVRTDVLPEKKTSKTTKSKPKPEFYLPCAKNLIGNNEMEMKAFKDHFKEKTGLGDNKIRDFIKWATGGDAPHLKTREVRGPGIHEKWISIVTI